MRKSGKSFKEIAKQLNCNVSTVAYYCSPNSKNLSFERNKVSYSWRVKLRKQIKDNYNLDHKIPVSKGGTNDISNLGITCPEANSSKSDLTVDEYISLCKEILLNFGYKIINP